MPILLFLIDTSASMNQRTDLGTSYLDIAKGAVELFLKVKGGERRGGGCSCGMGAVGLRCFCNVCIASPRFLRDPSVTLAPQLRARDPASRGDRYMLVTYDEPPYCIKVKRPAGEQWRAGGRATGGRRAGGKSERVRQPPPEPLIPFASARGDPASPLRDGLGCGAPKARRSGEVSGARGSQRGTREGAARVEKAQEG